MRTQGMRTLESFFDNVNEETSINASIARFFDAMKVLSEDPLSGASSTQLRTRADDMVHQLNTIFEGLVELQHLENLSVETKTNDINRLAAQIQELNIAIYSFEVTGAHANDLRDKRNVALDELSRLVDIDYKEYSENELNLPGVKDDPNAPTRFRVTVAGVTLVDHNIRTVLEAKPMPANADTPGLDTVFIPHWTSTIDHRGIVRPLPGGETPLNMSIIEGGEVKAHMDLRDGTGAESTRTSKGIPYYIEMMNNLARALVQEINQVHRQGWSDHPVTGSQTGINFFNEENSWVTWVRTADNATFSWVPTDPDGDPNVGSWVNDNDPTETIASPPPPTIDGFNRVLDFSQITAENIRLSNELIDSAFNIAASSEQILPGVDGGDAEQLQRGNNENVLALYRLFLLQDIRVGGEGIGSFDGFATSIRFDVGDTLRASRNAANTSRSLLLAMDNQRRSIADVSLDEEMTHMVRFSHAYNGAARVITAMDEMLDRLINGTGRVGL